MDLFRTLPDGKIDWKEHEEINHGPPDTRFLTERELAEWREYAHSTDSDRSVHGVDREEGSTRGLGHENDPSPIAPPRGLEIRVKQRVSRTGRPRWHELIFAGVGQY
jgi:hypothetical protein